jgi:hypothetical protein
LLDDDAAIKKTGHQKEHVFFSSIGKTLAGNSQKECKRG